MSDTTRRDHFAMAALQMLNADEFWVNSTVGYPSGGAENIRNSVARAYQWADAMIAASGTPDPRVVRSDVAAVELALEIADSNAPGILESYSVPVIVDGDTWYDLDSSDEEHKEELAAELRYCELRGLLQRHPEKPNLFQTLEP